MVEISGVSPKLARVWMMPWMLPQPSQCKHVVAVSATPSLVHGCDITVLGCPWDSLAPEIRGFIMSRLA